MGRKTKKKQRDTYSPSKWKNLKDYLIIFDGFTKALTQDEINEITVFMRSYCKILVPHTKIAIPVAENYIISSDTCNDFEGRSVTENNEIFQILCRLRKRMSTLEPFLDLNERFYSDFINNLPLLSAEAIKKGFTSILTYVHFIKLTLLEEDGEYRIVSEVEQCHTRRWFLIKENFLMKWDIRIEMETPLIKPMLYVNLPGAGRLNPVNRRPGGKGDTVASLDFPELETENIPSAGMDAICDFVRLRESVVAETNLVIMPDMPESKWHICKNQTSEFIRRATAIKSRINKVMDGMLTKKNHAMLPARCEIQIFLIELRSLFLFSSAKLVREQAR